MRLTEIAVLGAALILVAAGVAIAAVLLARWGRLDTDCDEFERDLPRASVDFDPRPKR